MLAQALDRNMPGQIGPVGLWTLAILVVLCGAFTAMLDVRPWVVALVVLGQLIFFGAAPFFFDGTGSIPTACRHSAGLAAGRSPMPRPVPRSVPSVRNSAAMPNPRLANIFRATLPRKSCAIPPNCR
jgi:hypothetical protein